MRTVHRQQPFSGSNGRVGPSYCIGDVAENYSNDPEQGISGSPLPDNFLL